MMNLKHLNLILAAALAVHAAPALAMDLPPPGLYRIDTDATMRFNGNDASMRIAHDGATGDATARAQADGRSAERSYKGDQPQQHCVAKLNGAAPLPPGNMAACTSKIVGRSGDSVTVNAVCPSITSTLTIRQLDRDRWEYLTEVQQFSPKGSARVDGLAGLLKQQARHAPTAAERAQAQRQLDALPAMQQQMSQQHAHTVAQMEAALRASSDPEEQAALRAALAQLGGATPTMSTRARAVWTRIADTCLGQAR